MSAPPKPWEKDGSSNLTSKLADSTNASSASAPPPPPPQSITRYEESLGPSFGGIGGSYGGFMNRYGMNHGMNAYGGYGLNNYGNFSPYGFSNYYGAGTSTDFATLADASVRPAFQSIEHVVHAFSNISMMLESTYFALNNSFRAVIGVADHMSRVGQQLGQVFASLSIIRTLRWIIRRTLHVLGIREETPELLWKHATESHDIQRSESSSWPIVVFFSVIMGGPYLIYNMFLPPRIQRTTRWMTGEGPHYKAVTLFDFSGREPNELSFRAGEPINLAPKDLQPRSTSWLIGSVDGKTSGLIPVNYVRNLGFNEGIAIRESQSMPSTKIETAPSCSSESSDAANEFVKVNIQDMEKTP